MKDSIPKKSESRKRERHVIGTQTAKQLLLTLREMRQWEAKQGASGILWKNTEEIEWWEDMIRASVKGWQRAPREQLDLDRETTAALDEVCGFHKRGYQRSGAALDFRRTLALRAIKAVCQALLNSGPGEGAKWYDFAVTLRDMTEAEKKAELLAMTAGAT